MRQQVARLLKATANPMYAHEQGEPYKTCLALHNALQMALDRKVVLTYEEIVACMTALKNSWDNVQMARSRALGQRITESWVRSSEAHDVLTSYLDYLSERSIPQVELDQLYVSIFNQSVGDNNNGY